MLPNLASAFCVFCVIVYIITNSCLLLLYYIYFSGTKPRGCLGRSPKWPVLCRVGHKALTRSVNQ